MPIQWEVLRQPGKEPVFPRERLDKGILGRVYWRVQNSGVSIPNDVAQELEKQWARFIKRPRRTAPATQSNISAYEGEPYETRAFRRGRSRWLRDQAFDASNGVCAACRRDFSKLLGGAGIRALQVHHKKQPAYWDKPKLTRVSDLVVVCANCHALVHANPKKALSVAKLRNQLRN